jgi:hypothetical protein
MAESSCESDDEIMLKIDTRCLLSYRRMIFLAKMPIPYRPVSSGAQIWNSHVSDFAMEPLPSNA